MSYAICELQRRRPACASVQSDQRLCFRCLDSIIPILAKSRISKLYHVSEQAGLSLTWSQILEDTFSRDVAQSGYWNYCKDWKNWDTGNSSGYYPKILSEWVLLRGSVFKTCIHNGKQCRTWSDCSCSILVCTVRPICPNTQDCKGICDLVVNWLRNFVLYRTTLSTSRMCL